MPVGHWDARDETDYENLDYFVGSLQQSAIDLYMYSNYNFLKLEEPSSHLYTRRHFAAGDDAICTVTRPDDDGLGGGICRKPDGTIYEDPAGKIDFEVEFEEVRRTIDNIIMPWRELPGPDDVQTQIDSWRLVARDLSGTATNQQGIISGASDISANLFGIHTNVDNMSGAAIAQFKEKFVNKLGNAIAEHYAIAVLCGGALTAERDIFKQARKSVMEAVVKTRNAMANIAFSEETDPWSVALKIAQWSLEGAQAFAGGSVPLKTALSSFALKALQASDVEGKSRSDKTAADDYNDAIGGFKANLDEINAEITKGEKALSDNLIKNLETINKDRDSYDLKVEPISSPQNLVIIQPDLIEEITGGHRPGGGYMRNISQDLRNNKNQAAGVSMERGVRRPEDIGIGEVGPSGAFNAMRERLMKLMDDMAWDVENGAAMLQKVMDALRSQDANSQKELESINQKIEKGSGIDPWG